MKILAKYSLVLTVLTATSLANAQTVTFANFQQVGGNKSFEFLNSGASSQFVTSPASIPVNFFFQVPNGSGFMNVALPASLTITSIVSAPASIGIAISQPLQSVQMTFVGTGAVTGNLLTIINSTGTIGGISGDSAAGLEETHNGGSQIVNYSSDYLSFTGSTQRNYSLALNNLVPALADGGNGYLAAFQSNATGQFASNGIVPEPSSLALLSLGVVGIVVRRRRK